MRSGSSITCARISDTTMGIPIQIRCDGITLQAELNDSPAAQAVADALPVTAPASRWGDEIYFTVDVDAELAPDARTEMAVGELAFWAPGRVVCILFGPTPASHGEEPRLVSEGNPIGMILDDAAALRDVADGAAVTLEPTIEDPS